MYLQGIRQILPLVRTPPFPAILDIGTGTGISLFEAMRSLGPCRLAVGVDISPGMVQVATQKARASGLSAQFFVGDAEALPLPSTTFNLAIANSCYHWFRNKRAALAEARRVLLPGGQLLLLSAAPPCFAEWFAVLDTVLRQRWGKSAPMPDLPTREQVGTDLIGAGLMPDHLVYQRRRMLVRDPLGFSQVLSTVAPYFLAGLDATQQSQVEATVAQAIASAFPAGFPVTWAAIEAVARAPPAGATI